jgi:hypothetical protein
MLNMCRLFIFVTNLMVVLATLLACSWQDRIDVASAIPTPTGTAIASVVQAATPVAPTATAVAQTPAVAVYDPIHVDPVAGVRIFPSPLYYIEDTSGQIWRVDVDGANPLQITHEPAPVLAFDVSPIDGHLVYVSGNSLIEADALGGNPRVILAGPTVPLANQHYGYVQYGPTQTVAAPRFSPDGQQIASRHATTAPTAGRIARPP